MPEEIETTTTVAETEVTPTPEVAAAEVQIPTPSPELTEADVSAFDKFLPGKSTVKDFDPTKKPEVVKPVEEPPAPVKPIIAPKVDSRDAKLEGFTDNEKALLKKMSNESFELVMARFDKLKEAESKRAEAEKKLAETTTGKLPDYWAEHEEAYSLSPTYKELSTQRQLGSAIVKHWEEQFAKVEAGEKWRGLEYHDGKVVISSLENEPSPVAKAKIMAAMNAASHESNQVERELKQFVDGHKSQYGKVMEEVKHAESTLFERYKDEKAPQYVMVQKAMEAIPTTLRGSPLAKITAKAMAMCFELTQALATYKEKEVQATNRATVVKSQGPLKSGESTPVNTDTDADLWDKFNANVRK